MRAVRQQPGSAAAGLSGELALREWTESLAFTLPVVVLPGLLWSVLRAPGTVLAERAACYGSTVVGVFFLHHASINSGAWHLSQCLWRSSP
jgi:hypothetical protein